MGFAYAITIRSQPNRHEDYGRGLELVAFSPGVHAARVITNTGDSITIGYNGHQCADASAGFRHALEVDGLCADGPLWELKAVPDESTEVPAVLHPHPSRRGYSSAMLLL
jgi:hypothetical protein